MVQERCYRDGLDAFKYLVVLMRLVPTSFSITCQSRPVDRSCYTRLSRPFFFQPTTF